MCRPIQELFFIKYPVKLGKRHPDGRDHFQTRADAEPEPDMPRPCGFTQGVTNCFSVYFDSPDGGLGCLAIEQVELHGLILAEKEKI